MLLLAACAASADSTQVTTDPTADWLPGDGPDVAVSGKAFVFGPGGGSLAGATVSVLEDPSRMGVVAEDGTFSLDVPSGAPLSFVLARDGFTTVQSATVDPGADGLADVGFQVPTPDTVTLLALAAQVDLATDLCQVATTVSSAASPPYGGAGVGEPGATVTLGALPDGASGPIYFDYLSESLILPDPDLTATTIDGGVLFANLPTGAYTLHADKEGVEFTEAAVRCHPGALVNAAPPHGIEAE